MCEQWSMKRPSDVNIVLQFGLTAGVQSKHAQEDSENKCRLVHKERNNSGGVQTL